LGVAKERTLTEVLGWPARRAGPALVGGHLRVGEVDGFVLSTRTSLDTLANTGQLWTPVVDSGHGLAVGCASGGSVMFSVVAFDGRSRDIVRERIGGLDGRYHVSGEERVAAAFGVRAGERPGSVLDPAGAVEMTMHDSAGNEADTRLLSSRTTTEAGEIYTFWLPREFW
jgi:hypothetical protein